MTKLTNEAQELMENLVLNAITRKFGSNSGGFAFGTSRDYYKVFGWKRDLTYEDYWNKYDRQDIATRIVEAPAEDSWKNRPTILDGVGEAAKEDSTFTSDLKDFAERLDLWSSLEDIDILSGIGRYGCLLIGTGKDFKEPLEEGSKQDVLYLRGFTEGDAAIDTLNKDSTSIRYMLPEYYRLNFEGTKEQVHWSHIIHVAEDARRSRVSGRSRLHNVFNLLDDLLKVVGGSSEAIWRLVYKGVVLKLQDGYAPPEELNEKQELEERIDDFVNDVRRILIADGYEVQDLGSQTVDASSHFDILMTMIATTKKTPKRILMGSERGELASTQDQRAWSSTIARRQERHVEPNLLKPTLNWLINHKVISSPSSNVFSVKWQELYELTPEEKAKQAKDIADTANTYTGGFSEELVTPEEIRETIGLTPTKPESQMEDDRLEFDREPVQDVN